MRGQHSLLAPATLCTLMLLHPVADAAPFSSTMPQTLLELCQADDISAQRFCEGYVTAATEASASCIPDGISISTVRELAVDALRTAVDTQPVTSLTLIGQRLTAVFPCTQASQNPATDEPASADPSPNDRSPNWSNKSRYGK